MTEHLVPNVILRGGDPLRSEDRLHHVPDPAVPKIKLDRVGHYDHFEASRETARRDELELPVFVWTGRTYVAE